MIFPVNGYPLIRMSQPSYSKGTVGFKMSHIEAKSINIWLRYDQKCNPTSCPHSLDGEITFWVVSQPKVDGFCFNMAHCDLDDHVVSPYSNTFEYSNEQGKE